MRYSQAFIPTLKEVPKDATTPSHVLLLRAGYVRMVGAGIYEMLPLGLRVMTRIATIVREEMDRAGAQEMLMPALLPADYFRESGRWDAMHEVLLKLRDRKGSDYHLGPTHEEIVTDVARRELRSYRQLPLSLYQIQMKFRDEPRPRAGLLRCREFLMKDAYSFDVDEAGALASYARMRDAYSRIFGRLGLQFRIVQADPGAMGGSTSAEFQVLAQNGEDAIVACSSCDYAANVEIAEARLADDAPPDPARFAEKKTIPTPGAGSIEDVVKHIGGGLTPAGMLKCLLYNAGKQTVMAVVRGDHEVNEIKLARALGADAVHLATDAQVTQATGAAVGFAGPVGFKGDVIADPGAAALLNAVTGANETDRHVGNVNYGRDWEGRVASIRQVTDGDACPKCGQPLRGYRGIEGGHIFVLGTRYSAQMGAKVLDEKGDERPIVMGCYGIGVSRLVATVIEQHHDADGIRWPIAVAPYQVLVTSLGKEDEVKAAAERVYDDLRKDGLDVLYDDRDERPGVKFKDADLIGVPLRITIGARGLKEGQVELKWRTEKEVHKVPLAECAARARDLVRAALSEGAR